ncbi:hypothetical protein Hanom_Chr03g00230391 [Helianthus anomalus]
MKDLWVSVHHIKEKVFQESDHKTNKIRSEHAEDSENPRHNMVSTLNNSSKNFLQLQVPKLHGTSYHKREDKQREGYVGVSNPRDARRITVVFLFLFKPLFHPKPAASSSTKSSQPFRVTRYASNPGPLL